MQDVHTDESFPIVSHNHKVAILLLFVLIGYAMYTTLYYFLEI